MGHARLLMEITNTTHHLVEEIARSALAQRPRLHHWKQITLLGQLHHNEVNLNALATLADDNLTIEVVLNQPNHVLVLEAGQQLNLIL